jgi:hypothetical protein
MANYENNDEDNEDKCSVCYENLPYKKNLCGHTCCYLCFYKMIESGRSTCHICRKCLSNDPEFSEFTIQTIQSLRPTVQGPTTAQIRPLRPTTAQIRLVTQITPKQRCIGIKRDGLRCNYSTRDISIKCRIHQDKATSGSP